MFEILLPIDFDTERARRGVSVVKSLPDVTNSVKVTILNVQTTTKTIDGYTGQLSPKRWFDEAAVPESVEKAESSLIEAGVAVETRREHAEPAASIIEVAKEIHADLIMVIGRNRTPVGEVLIGDVTDYVLRNANRPVSLIP